MWWMAYSLTDRKNIGSVRLNTQYGGTRTPIWLLLLKMLGTAAMLVVGYALVTPSIPLPTWQAMTLATGLIMLYVGTSFFVRPEPNTDDLGWFGGMVDNPFSYSDGINRWLWSIHCALGPGRFIAETGLDLFQRLGVMTEETTSVAEEGEAMETEAAPQVALGANRFQRPTQPGPDPQEDELAGCEGLTSVRFFRQNAASE